MKPPAYLVERARLAVAGKVAPHTPDLLDATPYLWLVMPTDEDAKAFFREKYRARDEGRALRLCLAAAIAGEEESRDHFSDCARHNEPAYRNGVCDCDHQ